VGAAQALSGELDAVGNSLVVWAAPAMSETPVMEPVTYKGQRADGWMRDIAARESVDSLRLTRETRYRFAVSQQKCDHLPLEKFDWLARALRFDLTRRRTRLLRRPLRVSFVVRGLEACPSSRPERLDPRKSLKIKATERNNNFGQATRGGAYGCNGRRHRGGCALFACFVRTPRSGVDMHTIIR
jgi:hypothetical protein